MTRQRPSAVRVWLSWGFVAIPLGWGIFQTVKTSLALFR